MNIAVISSPKTASGQSSFISMLASVFSLTQDKRAAILSTDDINDIISMNETKDTQSLVKSPNVYRAQIMSASIKNEDIWDYGFRLGIENVYAFDIAPKTLPPDEQVDVFSKTLARIKAPMVLLEITGDPCSDTNTELLKLCDVVLYVFNHTPKEYAHIKRYIETSKAGHVINTGYVCQRMDARVTSEKAISKEINVDVKRIMQIPYNPVIPKEAMKGKLNTLADYIARGHYEVVELRMKFLEIMQYLYDGSSKKYIKEVSKWGK